MKKFLTNFVENFILLTAFAVVLFALIVVAVLFGFKTMILGAIIVGVMSLFSKKVVHRA